MRARVVKRTRLAERARAAKGPSVPRQVPPSSAPDRPLKRRLSHEFSPTGNIGPGTHQPVSTGGRSSSVHGRGRTERTRISFGDIPASSDWEECFFMVSSYYSAAIAPHLLTFFHFALNPCFCGDDDDLGF